MGLAVSWLLGFDSRYLHLILLVCGVLLLVGSVTLSWQNHLNRKAEYKNGLAGYTERVKELEPRLAVLSKEYPLKWDDPPFSIMYPLPAPVVAKADAYEAWYDAIDPFDFQQRLNKLDIPTQTKTALMKAKAEAISTVPPGFRIAPTTLRAPSDAEVGFDGSGLGGRSSGLQADSRIGATPSSAGLGLSPFRTSRILRIRLLQTASRAYGSGIDAHRGRHRPVGSSQTKVTRLRMSPCKGARPTLGWQQRKMRKGVVPNARLAQLS